MNGSTGVWAWRHEQASWTRVDYCIKDGIDFYVTESECWLAQAEIERVEAEKHESAAAEARKREKEHRSRVVTAKKSEAERKQPR